MRYRLLGPVQATADDGGPLRVAAPRRRADHSPTCSSTPANRHRRRVDRGRVGRGAAPRGPQIPARPTFRASAASCRPAPSSRLMT